MPRGPGPGRVWVESGSVNDRNTEENENDGRNPPPQAAPLTAPPGSGLPGSLPQPAIRNPTMAK